MSKKRPRSVSPDSPPLPMFTPPPPNHDYQRSPSSEQSDSSDSSHSDTEKPAQQQRTHRRRRRVPHSDGDDGDGQGTCRKRNLSVSDKSDNAVSASPSAAASASDGGPEKKRRRTSSFHIVHTSSSGPTAITTSVALTPILSERGVVLILDTNILLEAAGLDFLEKLIQNRYDDVLPNLSVIIPHIVFLELDSQKSRRQSDLAYRARCAGRFLSENLCDHLATSYVDHGASTSRTPGRISGQTLTEFTEIGKKYDGRIPDDQFLFCCLQYQEKYAQLQKVAPAQGSTVVKGSTVVIAVTNDKLLRTRCVVNYLTCQSLVSLLDNVERRRVRQASLFDWASEPPEAPIAAVPNGENKENEGKN
ncbi:hypothetical protein BV898_02586 [Hypsibius exemplaris]|uniref:PIN domain-containing protein n=1 Tax=Hypsibius exemplaris TaxID=2072580 RepID=A0A1W0X7D3_HYPEX|nr:hypothetical protein BV898_02586 [Hypsibius exemplaris]